jgi:hypothetical protein
MQFPVKTCLGRFQTRSNRIVTIQGNENLTELISGEKTTRRIWNGILMKADGKTVDTAHQWEDNGAFRNQRGVACPLDLVILIAADPVPDAPCVATATPTPALQPPSALACPFCHDKLRNYHAA